MKEIPKVLKKPGYAIRHQWDTSTTDLAASRLDDNLQSPRRVRRVKAACCFWEFWTEFIGPETDEVGWAAGLVIQTTRGVGAGL